MRSTLTKVLLLALIFAFAVCGAAIAESEDTTVELEVRENTDYYYVVSEADNQALILAYKSTTKSVTVPSKLDGAPVVGIMDQAFHFRMPRSHDRADS